MENEVIHMNKLNLGCGRKIMVGYINVDNNANCQPDVVHDLNNMPYPFSDNQFSEIIMNHTIEHLTSPLLILQEIYRIGDNNCTVIIRCPHFSGNWIHPDHKSAISSKLFDFLKTDNSEYYGQTNYIVEQINLSWLRPQSAGKRQLLVFKFLNKIINFFANISVSFTERIWCYWVGGFEEIYFKVRIKK